MENVDFNAIEAEKKEIRLLISNGISFVVNYMEKREVKIPRWSWCKWLKKTVITKEPKQKEFIVKEPTAFTLDRLTAEYIELAIDEEKIREAPRQQARLYFQEHDKRMALIIAIAILGNDWEDTEQLTELANFIFKWTTNSQQHELVQAIDLTNNLADFINSIRLLSSARTTIPNRIENPED
ncbi:hypothetical protein M2451_002644 [Dysgonomonas sp. PFB1-18]|uniref:hypothetical protein n=1 Tax=unclassified Dysgonomonas TaxID=2630389 RepID=UPI002476AE29|nr:MULTISPECIES: hypothetical protein [unclassified Dysgonomonas]MDH6308125.1 hypothetical protein [Dysgonomonas sp. PF1-14]MDH6339664.1 hypothetical protein [Dysgonomonas sp. PF1-16]MDH6381315.1 hypothetical protein [Dysgonomonas sp. PFB1-18]MDH6398527.1 hypothetical protein [Dysgonomonas sp. PF1-23]